MKKLLLIDGNSIINRAFYGIMGNKMLMTPDGTYTNAVYGFLSIMFKELDEVNPDYIAIAFDLKAPTHRHKMYDGYKATRKGMPNELASQLPILKNILSKMNITIIEKEGYEADDILGTLSRIGEKNNLSVTILSGDRDTFQLITKNICVKIPRTKAGKTETEEFTLSKIEEVYGIEPIELIEVKGLMGDKSDNIPGVPGVGEKTALDIVKKYKTIENLYEKIEKDEDDLKGALKNKITENRKLAELSKKLGTIDINVPLEIDINDIETKEWNREEVLSIFKELRFSRFIRRFNLENEENKDVEELFKIEKILESNMNKIVKEAIEKQEFYYYIEKHQEVCKEKIINKTIDTISIYSQNDNTVYELKLENRLPKEIAQILENENIKKISYGTKEDYILLKQIGIEAENMAFDVKIAAYLLNSNSNQYGFNEISNTYLNIDYSKYLSKFNDNNEKQISLFSNENEADTINYENALKTYCIFRLKTSLKEELEKLGQLELLNNIEMPLIEVLSRYAI